MANPNFAGVVPSAAQTRALITLWSMRLVQFDTDGVSRSLPTAVGRHFELGGNAPREQEPRIGTPADSDRRKSLPD